MGIGPKDAEFVWNICLCKKVFKGPEGRSDWYAHIGKCEVMQNYLRVSGQ